MSTTNIVSYVLDDNIGLSSSQVHMVQQMQACSLNARYN